LKGGNGCISITANVALLAKHSMMMAGLVHGDEAEAMRMIETLESLHSNIFCESKNPIPVKWALKRVKKVDS